MELKSHSYIDTLSRSKILFVEIHQNIALMTRRLKPRLHKRSPPSRTKESMGYLRWIVFITMFNPHLENLAVNCQLFFGLVRHQVMPAAKRAIAQLNKNENAKGCHCINTGI